jgi:pyruvate-formate lyase-activating enzyme
MLLQIVYWYNPLLWLVRQQVHHLRELSCDGTVAELLRERTLAYRQTLLETARRLAGTGKQLLFRVPVIPGVNDTREAMGAIAAFVQDLSRKRDRDKTIGLELLPFHPLGSDKYGSLGMGNPTAGMDALPRERQEELERLIVRIMAPEGRQRRGCGGHLKYSAQGPTRA